MKQGKLVHRLHGHAIAPTGRWYISPPSFGNYKLYIESKRKWYLSAEWIEDCYVQEVNDCHEKD